MHRMTDRTRAIASMLGAIFSYGLTPVLLRTFVDDIDAWTVNGIRYSVSALFWLPLVLMHRGRYGRRAGGGGSTIWRDAAIPSILNTLGQIGWGLSPYFLTAPVIAFVYRLSFLFTVALGFALVASERPLARRPAFWLGAVVSVAGLVMLLGRPLGAGNTITAAGIVIVLFTNLMFASYSVSVRLCLPGYPVRLSFGVISLYTGGALLPLMFAFGHPGEAVGIGAEMWATLVVSALIGIAISHVLYYHSIHSLGATVSAGLLMSTPFVTAVLAALFLGEKMNAAQAAGGLSMIAGGGLLLLARGQVQEEVVDRQTG